MDQVCLKTDKYFFPKGSICLPKEVSNLKSGAFPISIFRNTSLSKIYLRANSLGQTAVSNLLKQLNDLTPLNEQLVIQPRSIFKESSKNTLIKTGGKKKKTIELTNKLF